MSDNNKLTPVTISYKTLVASSNSSSVGSLLNEAFSSHPDSLGLLLVNDLPPTFTALRKRGLLFANRLASLNTNTLKSLEDPSSSFSWGWSHGKESFNGKPDTSKGSYYNTPHDDERNIWPQEDDCKGFQEAFEELCKVMCEVGDLVAKACDGLEKGEGWVTSKSISKLIQTSRNSKARLLHYFPPPGQILQIVPSSTLETGEAEESKVDDSWCGTHIDSSLLTALCPAIYLFHPTPQEGEGPLSPILIPSPSLNAGLFIKARNGLLVQAAIPEDCLAFQTGETLELLSSGALGATPHFVNGTADSLNLAATKVIERKKEEDESWRGVQSGVVTRETMAVFLQPNADEVISSSGETFGEFWNRVLQRHY